MGRKETCAGADCSARTAAAAAAAAEAKAAAEAEYLLCVPVGPWGSIGLA